MPNLNNLKTAPDVDPNSFAGNSGLLKFWYPVARAVDVNPGPKAVKLLNRNFVIWRNDSETSAGDSETSTGFSAAIDRCPHREAPLSAGSVTDGNLECPYHGWTFAGDGACVRIPSALPEVPISSRAHLETFGVVERYGLLWLCPLPDSAAPDDSLIPRISQDVDASFRRINTPVEIWQTSAPRLVDNFMDFSHFPFVHVGTFGNSDDTVIPKLELGDLDDGYYGYQYGVQAQNPSIAEATSKEQGDFVEREMSTGFCLPTFVRSTIEYRSGLSHILLLLSTPRDDFTSYFTFVVWRNDDFATPADEIIRFDLAIGAEDKAMLEQVQGLLPLDLKSTLNVQADKPSVEWRRQFAKLLEGADNR